MIAANVCKMNFHVSFFIAFLLFFLILEGLEL